jgi:transposase-like protein
MTDVPEDVQRWTAKRRVVLVLSIVRGETSVAEAARKHGLTVAEVEEWQERLLRAAENALRARPKDEEALKDEQIKKQPRLAAAVPSEGADPANVRLGAFRELPRLREKGPLFQLSLRGYALDSSDSRRREEALGRAASAGDRLGTGMRATDWAASAGHLEPAGPI